MGALFIIAMLAIISTSSICMLIFVVLFKIAAIYDDDYNYESKDRHGYWNG